ncbi:MAG: Gldg family protein [Planctomycetes bacterium]|nr:Gldg family protein [Planctomycetota bacterium]
MNPTLRTILAIICIGIITVCAVLIVRKATGAMRVDLTEYKLYTLSQGTTNILKDLKMPGDRPVTLRLYFSRVAAMKRGTEHIRYWTSYYLYVRDLLEEYVNLAGGKLRLEVVDPRTYSEEEEEAISYQLKGFPLGKDENFYFGLVAKTEIGTAEVIDFFEPQRQEFVEYDVSRLISRLIKPAQETIGVYSSLPVMGTPPQMAYMMQMQGKRPEPAWVVIEALRMDYEVRQIALDSTEIPEGLDTLILIHPKDLSEEALFAIDQYVMKGGKLLVFVDPHCFYDQPVMDPKNPQAARDHKFSSDLNALLKKWGVEMPLSQFAADRTLGMEALPNRNAFPTFMGLTEECVNPDELISGRLHSLRMVFAGVLRETDEDAEVKVVPLLTTTKIGNVWQPRSPYDLQRPDPDRILSEITDGIEPLMLACRITGKLKTNFPDGIVIPEEELPPSPEELGPDGMPLEEETKAEEPQEKRLEAIKETAENNTVVVVADVEFLTDGQAFAKDFFGYSQANDNLSFVLNSLEFLAGSTDLVSIRSRGNYVRPFTRVEEIEAEAKESSDAEIERLNLTIKAEKDKLEQLAQNTSRDDFKNILAAAMSGRVEIEKRIREAELQITKLKNQRRKKVEELENDLRMKNMVAAPAVILLIAIILAALRYLRTKRYAVRRA